ncbi:MAG: hypothetical protein ACLSHC_03105 [Bilophila wadsworthia]
MFKLLFAHGGMVSPGLSAELDPRQNCSAQPAVARPAVHILGFMASPPQPAP